MKKIPESMKLRFRPILGFCTTVCSSGCTALERLILTGEDPAAYVAGDGLRDGADFFICVPEGALGPVPPGLLLADIRPLDSAYGGIRGQGGSIQLPPFFSLETGKNRNSLFQPAGT